MPMTMNNTVDSLAKATLAPDTPPLDVLSLPLPDNWVDSGPVLNNQSLAFLTESIISCLPPPIFSLKFCPLSVSWSLWVQSTFGVSLDPALPTSPTSGRIHVPVGLCKLLWKHAASSLPIRRSWHSSWLLRPALQMQL
jgi:hypothetical protein